MNEVIGKLAFKDNSELVDVLLNERDMSGNTVDGASSNDVFEEVKGTSNKIESAQDQASAPDQGSKISEDEMKKKLLEAAAASKPVEVAQEDAEGLEDMLDDLI